MVKLSNKLIGILGGSFDPVHKGHVTISKIALQKIKLDRIYWLIAKKNPFKTKAYFSLEERLDIINNSLFKDLKISKKKIKIISFDNLTIDLCKKYKAGTIIRGLRAVSDFEYEFQLAGMNKKLNSKIETMFLMSDVENQIISSKFVKEIVRLKGDIKKFTTKSTIKSLKEKYE